MKKIFSRGGFTLVEMLIVISIIAILAGVFLTGLGGFRGSANDTKKLADLQKIASYLELYYNKSSSYPNFSDWASLKSELDTTLSVSTPVDNTAGGDSSKGYQYKRCDDGNGWVVAAYLSDSKMAARDYLQNPCTASVGSATCNTSASGSSRWYCVKN